VGEPGVEGFRLDAAEENSRPSMLLSAFAVDYVHCSEVEYWLESARCYPVQILPLSLAFAEVGCI
jgi:hypothetical protein